MSRSLEFLARAQPGDVVLITQKSWIHDLVRRGQTSVTPGKHPSQWAHVFIVGREGEGDDRVIYESDIYFAKSGLKNGAQANPMKKYGEDKKNVAICLMNHKLTDEEIDRVLAEARRKIDEGIQYPVLELVGTMWAYLTRTFRKPNPLDLEKASYCSSFVNNCYAVVERLVPAEEVHPTNVSPEHLFLGTLRNPTRRTLNL